MSSFLAGMLYQLEKGKYHLGVEYCLNYFFLACPLDSVKRY